MHLKRFINKMIESLERMAEADEIADLAQGCKPKIYTAQLSMPKGITNQAPHH